MSDTSGWQERDGCLVRELQFADFAEAFAFVTRVALVAQARDHHPDVAISWNRVTLTLTSHDAGRTITSRDRDLASAIDDLLA
jgi:4a-hydroxytetrahydrobiopterin dehydratase